ncbi:heme oxygenase (biliverdin-producing) [soil metagenome]
MSVTLSARLRSETSALHRQVESSLFMQRFLGSQLNLRGYCLLMRNLEPVYLELEQALERHAGDGAIAPVYMPQLFRTVPIQHDLHALHGNTWPQDFEVLPSSQAYAARLRELSASSPALLPAHAYVRYLGDLSGGQMLRDIVVRSLQLPAQDAATSFYEFGPPTEVSRLAQALRAGLNLVARDEAHAKAVVDEAKWAFGMHGLLFNELAQACGLTPL